jgi:hypothetical protein
VKEINVKTNKNKQTLKLKKMYNEEQKRNRVIVAEMTERLKDIKMNTSDLRDDAIMLIGLTNDNDTNESELSNLTTGTNVSLQRALMMSGKKEPRFKKALYLAAAELLKDEKEVPLLFAALEIVKSVTNKKPQTPPCKA